MKNGIKQLLQGVWSLSMLRLTSLLLATKEEDKFLALKDLRAMKRSHIFSFIFSIFGYSQDIPLQI